MKWSPGILIIACFCDAMMNVYKLWCGPFREEALTLFSILMHPCSGISHTFTFLLYFSLPSFSKHLDVTVTDIKKKRLKNGEMSLLCANLSDDSSPSALFKWLSRATHTALFAALFFAFWSMYSLCRSLSHCCHTTCVWGWFMAKVLSMHCYGDFRARTARLQNGRGWKGHQEIIKSSPLLTQVPYSRSHR